MQTGVASDAFCLLNAVAVISKLGIDYNLISVQSLSVDLAWKLPGF